MTNLISPPRTSLKNHQIVKPQTDSIKELKMLFFFLFDKMFAIWKQLENKHKNKRSCDFISQIFT